MDPEYACEPCHGGLQWSLLWGHETRERSAEMDPSTHAGLATGAFDGAPYGATKCVRSVPERTRVRMGALPLGPSMELTKGPRNE
eukprot:4512699-Pyramimonas_sp.AAC.1